MKKLPRDFYLGDTLEIAKLLLGKFLVHESPEGVTVGRIVEDEAYIGPEDKASHAYKYLRSSRTEIQYGLGGFAYIYQIYGMYYCFNIVTRGVGEPEVVLIRALEPVSGLELMAKRRGISGELNEKNKIKLANGPGKLCIAMGINKDLYGEDLCGDRLYLMEDGERVSEDKIGTSPRVNIDYAEEAREYPWRFFIRGNPFVSDTKKGNL